MNKETWWQLHPAGFNIPTSQWCGPHFGNSPQLLALNQTSPIWKRTRGEMWPDCLPGSFPAPAPLISPSGEAKVLSGRPMVPSGGGDTYPSESMLFSWTMAFRASELAAEWKRQREGAIKAALGIREAHAPVASNAERLLKKMATTD